MRRRYFLIIFSLLSCFVGFTQEVVSKEKNESIQFKSQSLKYSPEMPEEGSYSIILNVKNVGLTEEQLLEMNKHRHHDVPIEWKVNDDLVILLKPFKQ